MHTRPLAISMATALALALSACSPEPASAPPTPPVATAQAFDAVATGGQGFSVGPLVSAHTVYVLFDPQCPHCGHLWQAALPLLDTVRFVWVPVAIMNAQSLPQGAALLQASDPLAAMSAHESALLQGQGGLSAPTSVPDALVHTIQANTLLLNRLGADAVPLIVARHARSGEVRTHGGTLDTPALLSFLGLAQP